MNEQRQFAQILRKRENLELLEIISQERKIIEKAWTDICNTRRNEATQEKKLFEVIALAQSSMFEALDRLAVLTLRRRKTDLA